MDACRGVSHPEWLRRGALRTGEQQASEKFDPAQYKDEVRDRIETAVQQKVEGQEITTTEQPETGAQVIDLMEALRASLEKKPAKRVQSEKPAARKSAKK